MARSAKKIAQNIIRGTGKADTILGTDGIDKIFGNNGHDSIFGGLGDDILFGGNGRDLLDGGGGRNKLTGGRGNDTFRIDATLDDAFQTITDFEAILPGSPVKGRNKVSQDTLSIINAGGQAVVLVQNGPAVDLYIGGEHVAEIFGMDAANVFKATTFDAPPASFEIADAPPGGNRPPSVTSGVEVMAVEDTGDLVLDLKDFVQDPDGDVLTFASVGETVPGLTLFSDGSLTFDTDDAAYDYLNDGDETPITVIYSVADGNGGFADGSLLINLAGVGGPPPSAAPVAADGSVTLPNDFGVQSGTLRDLVTDADSPIESLSFSADSAPGWFSLDTDGSWTVDTNDSSSLGRVQVSYFVSDPEGNSDGGIFDITVFFFA